MSVREAATPPLAGWRDWVALARPRQWPKNLLLYAAFLFTAGEAWGIGDDGAGVRLFLRATFAFAAFCLFSSAGYLLNDARDALLDREHPRKRARPVASGRISAQRASRAGAALAAVGLVVALPLGVPFAGAAAAYLAGAVWYTLLLKRIPFLDVSAVAGLFVLRVLAGALAIDVDASPWILVCTFAGALFVASMKRQQEQWLLGRDAGAHRETVTGTSRWPRWVAISAAVATVTLYLLYTLEAPNVPVDGSMTVMTVPFVVAAVARYAWVARRHPHRDAEEIAFRDPVTLVLIVGFLVVAVTRLWSAGA